MAEIFGPGASGDYKGAFRTANIANGKGFTFQKEQVQLVQNFQTSFQQPVQPLFEIGSNARYYVVGKSSGTFSIAQILGFGTSALKAVTAMANPCSGDRTLTVVFPGAFCEKDVAGVGQGLTLTMAGVLLQSIGFTVAAQDNLISAQAQGLMVDLQYEAKG